jgi:hypothetical protein
LLGVPVDLGLAGVEQLGRAFHGRGCTAFCVNGAEISHWALANPDKRSL